MEIIPGIYQLKLPLKDNPLGYVNTYLLKGTHGWTLIDAGWNDAESFEALREHLTRLGLAIDDIEQILVTHIHPDHFGMAGRIKELSGATLALHEIEKAFIDARHEWGGSMAERMNAWLRLNGVPEEYLTAFNEASADTMSHVVASVPDRGLRHGEIISTGIFELEVFWTPGHSPGHVCLYEREHKILFTGDHVLPVTTPNISIHIESDWDPLGAYLKSLRDIEGLEVTLNLPAHEEIFENLGERIAQLFTHHDHRKREIIETISEQARTAFDISSRITWMEGQMQWETMLPLDRRIAVTEALAHLEALRAEGRVKRFVEEGISYYRAA